jgi:ribosome-associated protein
MDERPDLPSGADADTGPLGVGRGVSIPARDLSWRFSRSSGPGGQGVNTTDSRIELSVDLRTCEGLTDQQRARVLDRLAALLAEALAPPPPKRRPTKPSKGAVARRLDDKARRSKVKKLRNSWD